MKLSLFRQFGSNQHTVTAAELQTAMAHDELMVYLMPVVDVKKEMTVELEALLRWQVKEDEFIAPSEFIPLAEQNNLMPELTRWVVKRVLALMSAWRKHGCKLIWSINLSDVDLKDTSLIKDIELELKYYSVPATDFGIEICHRVVDQNATQAIDWLSNAKAAGLSLILDNYDISADYNTLPLSDHWDSIKIDRNVVMGRQSTAENLDRIKQLTKAGLNIKISAPGVHTFREWQKIKKLACDQAQGYYISPAQAPEEMELWLRMSTWGDRSADALRPAAMQGAGT